LRYGGKVVVFRQVIQQYVERQKKISRDDKLTTEAFVFKDLKIENQPQTNNGKDNG
jgi:hypothetical protein